MLLSSVINISPDSVVNDGIYWKPTGPYISTSVVDTVLFISNSMEEVNKYKSKGASFFALDLQDLISATVVGSETVTAMDKVFGKCTYVELSLYPKAEEKTKNSIYKPNISKLAYKQQEMYMEDT